MAKTTNVVTTDDLDGSANAATIRFGYQSTALEIDFSAKNAAALEAILQPYIVAARRVSGRARILPGKKKPPTISRPATGGPSVAEVRSWAEEVGLHVASRGRIGSDVREAYAAAH